MTTDDEIEAAARACYDVSCEAIRPNFANWPGGWTPETWDELKEIERELHRGYARAALSVTAPENVLGPEWGKGAFRSVLGESYTPRIWGKHRALNYASLKEVMDLPELPDRARDVIAWQIWRSVVDGNRSHYAFQARDDAEQSRGVALAHLAKHVRTLLAYAQWQVSDGKFYHPTLPSAMAAANGALKAYGLDQAAADRALRQKIDGVAHPASAGLDLPPPTTPSLDDLKRIATSAVFHFFCCGGGIYSEDPCGELVSSMARLARAVEFRSDPATNAEIAGIPVKVLDGDRSTNPPTDPAEDPH